VSTYTFSVVVAATSVATAKTTRSSAAPIRALCSAELYRVVLVPVMTSSKTSRWNSNISMAPVAPGRTGAARSRAQSLCNEVSPLVMASCLA
jgi:hypothetical protein